MTINIILHVLVYEIWLDQSHTKCRRWTVVKSAVPLANETIKEFIGIRKIDSINFVSGSLELFANAYLNDVGVYVVIADKPEIECNSVNQ